MGLLRKTMSFSTGGAVKWNDKEMRETIATRKAAEGILQAVSAAPADPRMIEAAAALNIARREARAAAKAAGLPKPKNYGRRGVPDQELYAWISEHYPDSPAVPEATPRAAESMAAGGAGASMVEELAGLADLHQRGALTDEEYAAAKSKLLG